MTEYALFFETGGPVFGEGYVAPRPRSRSAPRGEDRSRLRVVRRQPGRRSGARPDAERSLRQARRGPPARAGRYCRRTMRVRRLPSPGAGAVRHRRKPHRGRDGTTPEPGPGAARSARNSACASSGAIPNSVSKWSFSTKRRQRRTPLRRSRRRRHWRPECRGAGPEHQGRRSNQSRLEDAGSLRSPATSERCERTTGE